MQSMRKAFASRKKDQVSRQHRRLVRAGVLLKKSKFKHTFRRHFVWLFRNPGQFEYVRIGSAKLSPQESAVLAASSPTMPATQTHAEPPAMLPINSNNNDNHDSKRSNAKRKSKKGALAQHKIHLANKKAAAKHKAAEAEALRKQRSTGGGAAGRNRRNAAAKAPGDAEWVANPAVDGGNDDDDYLTSGAGGEEDSSDEEDGGTRQSVNVTRSTSTISSASAVGVAPHDLLKSLKIKKKKVGVVALSQAARVDAVRHIENDSEMGTFRFILTQDRRWEFAALNEDDRDAWMAAFGQAIRVGADVVDTGAVALGAGATGDASPAAVVGGAAAGEAGDSLSAAFDSTPTVTEIVAPVWMDDKATKACCVCGHSFGVLKRRHHCRTCGVLVCHSCTHMVLVTSLRDDKKVRICSRCDGSVGADSRARDERARREQAKEIAIQKRMSKKKSFKSTDGALPSGTSSPRAKMHWAGGFSSGRRNENHNPVFDIGDDAMGPRESEAPQDQSSYFSNRY